MLSSRSRMSGFRFDLLDLLVGGKEFGLSRKNTSAGTNINPETSGTHSVGWVDGRRPRCVQAVDEK